ALAFIFPAACFIKLSDPHLPCSARSKLPASILPASICVAFGVVVMIISLFFALAKSFSQSPEVATKICV
ncbi:hypothetical protein FRB90_009834, partial [Tulasnella sp. 427]